MNDPTRRKPERHDMTNLTIYGASDDLIEFEGAIDDELNCNTSWTGRLLAPDGSGLVVTAIYTDRGTWALGVAPLEDTRDGIGGALPDWDITITASTQCEYSAQLNLTVPDGTVVMEGAQ